VLFNARMDAIELLTTRHSNGKLTDPGPDDAALRIAFEAAARAPDHAALRPWRVHVVRGVARERLGALMELVLRKGSPNATDEELAKARNKALRAPLILVVSARIEPHPKAPATEQLLASGCAAHAMLLAFQALGYCAIWRTGGPAYDDEVKRAFGLRPSDAIVGFLYVGTAKQAAPAMARPAPESFVSEWQGPQG
jgi:nitroreductase